MLGNNNSIIFNSKYYKTVLFLGLCLVGITVLLNMVLIPKFGIEGAAIATLISRGLYSLAKLFFVVKYLHLFPFTRKTAESLLICVFSFFSIYFITFDWHPLFLIIVKTFLVAILYGGLHYFSKTSTDVNELLERTLGFFSNKKAS
jgi:O-antigen/teichoic acid export membrane protein